MDVPSECAVPPKDGTRDQQYDSISNRLSTLVTLPGSVPRRAVISLFKILVVKALSLSPARSVSDRRKLSAKSVRQHPVLTRTAVPGGCTALTQPRRTSAREAEINQIQSPSPLVPRG